MILNEIYSQLNDDDSIEETTENSPSIFPSVDENAVSQRHQSYITGGATPDHCTPSRRRENVFQPYQPHPYARDPAFQNPSGPFAESGNIRYHFNNKSPVYTSNNSDQMASLMESQRIMMKAQENLIDMVKKVSERVEELEESVSHSATSTNTDDVKKIPPELSVSLMPYIDLVN